MDSSSRTEFRSSQMQGVSCSTCVRAVGSGLFLIFWEVSMSFPKEAGHSHQQWITDFLLSSPSCLSFLVQDTCTDIGCYLSGVLITCLWQRVKRSLSTMRADHLFIHSGEGSSNSSHFFRWVQVFLWLSLLKFFFILCINTVRCANIFLPISGWFNLNNFFYYVELFYFI